MIDIKNWNLEQIISEPSSAAVTEVIKQNDAKVILKILFWITGALSKREGLNMYKFIMIDVKITFLKRILISILFSSIVLQVSKIKFCKTRKTKRGEAKAGPDRLLVAKWISQGGMLLFLTMFLSFFFFIGLITFFGSPEISQEISKKFPELPEDFMYFKEYMDNFLVFYLKNVVYTIPLPILTILLGFKKLLFNPNQKISRLFGMVFTDGFISS